MRPVKIITDSCSDLVRELREQYDIDYARMKTVYHDQEQWASLDFEYYTPKELYDIMRGGERILTTQVPIAEFERIFRLYLEQGMDIVYIACSSRQSGSVNTAVMVSNELQQEYPDAAVYCVDSLNACVGEGALAVRAAEYRDKGMSAKEVYEHIMADRKLINEFCTVHSLDGLRASGRVKASSAFFGNLLGVKPIIIADVNGDQTPIKKVKGRKNSIAELVALTKESIIDPEHQRIYIAHADCADEAEMLADRIRSEIPCSQIVIGYIGPIIGASIGPGAIAVFSFGKEVTFEAK